MPRRCDAQNRASDSVDEDRPCIRRKRLPLGAVMDERMDTGIEYSRFFAAFERYLKQPELPETCLGQGTPACV